MFKIMTKKAFEQTVSERVAKEASNLAFMAEQRKEANAQLRQRLSDAHSNMLEATKLIAEQNAMIEEMAPFAELGKKRRASYDADNAKRKARRVGS